MSFKNLPTLYLVDASIYIFRAWHSVPDDFQNADGHATNAVYGFAHFICELLEQVAPANVVIAFDESLRSSFRKEIYPEYKANRDPAPEALIRQFDWCRRIAEAMGIACFSNPEYEADDMIGSLAKIGRDQGHQIAIVSADKDLTQLIIGEDYLWDYARGNRLNRAAVHKRFGVYPEQIADFLALTGDAVDNIPGVPGIGPKTASTLLRHFNTLDELMQRLDEVGFLRMRGAKGIQTRLRENYEAAMLARQLTLIRLDALPSNTQYVRQKCDFSEVELLLDQLGFGRLLRQRCQRLV